MVLRAKKEKIYPEYLFAILQSSNVIAELQHLAETRSGTFPQITYSSELAPLPVLLPDFTTQEKIVGILKNLKEKIEENERINNNLAA